MRFPSILAGIRRGALMLTSGPEIDFSGGLRKADAMTIKIGSRGLALIKHFEGLELTSYQDEAGVWTIGVGHTATARENMRITEAQADSLLREDVFKAESAVGRLVTRPLSEPEADALISWVFNLGPGNFASSTLLKRLNDGVSGPDEIAKQIRRWNKLRKDGVLTFSRGLARRREAEAKLFTTGKYP